MALGSRRPLIAGNWKMNGLLNDSVVRVENILLDINNIMSPFLSQIIQNLVIILKLY